MSNSAEWSDLAAAAQQGDSRAYNRLLSEIAPYLRAILLRGLSDKGAVEDIVQEILISVHKSLRTYTPDRPFKPWLLAIANFRRTDYLRRHYAGNRQLQVPLEEADHVPAAAVTLSEGAGEYKDVQAALDSLPPRQRDVFTKLKIEGYTAQEVANQTGMNVSAVKVSAHRTLQKLKTMLAR